jgi:hypothetical protein
MPTAFQGGGIYTRIHMYVLILAHVSTASVAQIIQNVPGGKVSILGGHNIGYSKQKLFIYMCPIPNGFRDTAISLYSSRTVDKKERLRTVPNTGIYCSSDKVGAVYLV